MALGEYLIFRKPIKNNEKEEKKPKTKKEKKKKTKVIEKVYNKAT